MPRKKAESAEVKSEAVEGEIILDDQVADRGPTYVYQGNEPSVTKFGVKFLRGQPVEVKRAERELNVVWGQLDRDPFFQRVA